MAAQMNYSTNLVFLSDVDRGGSTAVRRASPGREERKFADVIKEKPIKVTVRVLVPVKEHPKVSSTTEGFLGDGMLN